MKRFEWVWTSLLALLVLSGVVAWATVSLDPAPQTPESIVQDFVTAYNSRDLPCMLSLATEDVEWMSVSSDGLSVETRGRDALRDNTASTFRSCPTCQASLEQVRRVGSRVTVVERSVWDSATGLMSRRSLSVYEFRGGLISRVYAFPAD